MSKKILIATEKPFAAKAVESIKEIADKRGYLIELLENYSDKAELKEAVKTADAMIIRSDKADKEILDAATNLKVIVRAGAGYDNIDTEAATANKIVAMNTPGQNSNAVAELAIGMMVYKARGLFNGKPGTELKDKTLGIHAFGNIGKNIARIAKGFGMKVYAFDPFISKEIIEDEDIVAVDSVEELYKKSQYISLNIPANDKTKNSINYELMSIMPENATIVNTARKEVVCEESLMKVMANRSDFNYIADIAPDCKAEIEAKYKDRCYFTPKKMGAQTAEANINAGIAAITQIINFFENGDTLFKVN